MTYTEHTLNNISNKHDPEIMDIVHKIQFYTVYGPISGKPAYTACLLFDENDYLLARGVSVCSVQDTYIEKQGYNRAMGRAIKALTNMCDSENFRTQSDEGEVDMIKVENSVGADKQVIVPRYLTLDVARAHFPCKSMYLPVPTKYEMDAFG